VQHLIQPKSVVPESVMPNYPWLMSPLDYSDVGARMRALRTTGVPYSTTQAEYDANVLQFGAEVAKQLHIPDAQKNLVAQAQEGNYDGDRTSVSEMDALVAYLQVLGTMVDFSKVKPEDLVKYR
jgi:cytochrome c oxidase cbb3-type subunit 2